MAMQVCFENAHVPINGRLPVRGLKRTNLSEGGRGFPREDPGVCLIARAHRVAMAFGSLCGSRHNQVTGEMMIWMAIGEIGRGASEMQGVQGEVMSGVMRSGVMGRQALDGVEGAREGKGW